jgi:hypothetical protein
MTRRLMIRFRSIPMAVRAHAALFVLLALPLGIVLVALVPLGQVPDERAHVLRAESLWFGELMGHVAPVLTDNGSIGPRGGVMADMSIATAAVTDMPPAASKVTEESRRAARASQWQTVPLFAAIGPIAGYFPVFYIPSAITIEVTRLMGFGPYDAAIAGRCANLAAYVALGVMALLITRRGRTLMLAALLLPISLHVAASLSEDGLFLATSCLAAAVMTRVRQAPHHHGRLRWMAAGLLGCIAMTKPPYLPMAALLLLPYPESIGWRPILQRLGPVIIVATVTVAWFAWAAHDVTAPFWRAPAAAGPQVPGPLWPGPHTPDMLEVDQAAQARVLRTHPSLLLTLPLRTMANDLSLWREPIGVLGRLNVLFPFPFYMVWIVAVAGALLADLTAVPGAMRSRHWPEAFLLLAACFTCIFVIYISQYISWTPVGAKRIEGPQGRYLLPLIPVLAVALPRFNVAGGAAIRFAGLLALATVGVIGIFVIPTTIVTFYYLAP